MGQVVGRRGGVQPWDRPPALQGERGGRSAAVGLPTGAPAGGWRVGGQPWDGPLALPTKGGETRVGAGGRAQGGGPPVRGTFRVPASLVTLGDARAHVQQTVGGEGTRRYSTGYAIHTIVQVDK